MLIDSKRFNMIKENYIFLIKKIKFVDDLRH